MSRLQISPQTSDPKLEAFKSWVLTRGGGEFMLSHSPHPKLWRGTTREIEKHERNPWLHPWTRGAWEVWCHLWKPL